MPRHTRLHPGLLLVLATACSSDRGSDPFGTASGLSSAGSQGSAEDGGEGGEAGGVSASASAGESGGSQGGTTGGGATTGATTGGPGSTGGSGTAGSTGGNDGGDGFRFDTPASGGGSAGDEGGGGCACGNTNWSYVWIANSSEGSVSKINTRTLQEEGRYLTRGDKAGNPSRTSVSIDGKAVVVANRNTGIIKIWARPEFCKGGNTSSGKTDVRAWGQDDCVAWYTPFPNMTVQRPVQWTTGTLNPTTCSYVDQKVWTTTASMGSGPGQCGKSGVWVHRLNGDTGAIEDTVHIPDSEFPCDHTGTDLGLGLGPYGGAVDPDNNFWFHGWGNSKLVRVDYDTLDYEIFSGGGYGITVDTKGRVWLSSSISRFDYATKQRQSANVSTSGGIAQDLQGRIWAAGQNGVVWVDMETLAVGTNVTLPGSGQVKGVSVDIDGYIWATFQNDARAFKIDPNTYAIDSYNGLSMPYTYSDMTGGQINNIKCHPPEG